MSEPSTYDVTSDIGKVRLLLNDVATPWVFTDAELQALIDLEGGVKRAAAQAIDTNATNLALATRVLRTQDVNLDGAKLADAMRKHADSLRAQADQADSDEGFFFDITPSGACHPELTEWPRC